MSILLDEELLAQALHVLLAAHVLSCQVFVVVEISPVYIPICVVAGHIFGEVVEVQFLISLVPGVQV